MTHPHHPDAESSRSRSPQRRAFEGGGTRAVALVTGAARRIGRAIALELAHAGFDIALHHRGTRPESFGEATAAAADLRAAGARVELFAADFADPAATAALLPAIAQAFGRIDAVVNSASPGVEGVEESVVAPGSPGLESCCIESNCRDHGHRPPP